MGCKLINVVYKARFQIEFVFRDAKQFSGLTDCQARSKEKLNFHFNASIAALNVPKIIDRISKPNETKQDAFSMTSWKTRFYNENFMKVVLLMLDIDPASIKLMPQFEELRNYGAIS